MNRCLVTLLFLAISSFLSAEIRKSDVLTLQSFELLTGSYNERQDRWRRFKEKDLLDLQFYAANYNSHISYLQFATGSPLRIPKVIHFIWIGPKPFPEESVANVQSWKDLHPDWRMLFWTDSKERKCPIKGMKRRLIDEISFIALKPYLSKTTNYAEKADLIRYELLYERGGVYVDHDVHALRSFDAFHRAFDFYAALENPHTNTGSDAKIFPCNCLIGARRGHPILKDAIEKVQLRWDEIGDKYPEMDAKNTFARVINRSFRAFTLAIEDNLSIDGNIDMVFPSSYFFSNKIFKRSTREQLFTMGHIFATHAFASTWREKKESDSSDGTD